MAKAGALFLVGGREDFDGDRVILREFARFLRRRPLVLVTVASRQPDEMLAEYREAFAELGVSTLRHVHAHQRDDARDPALGRLVEDAGGVYITGGDQLRVTATLGDTPVFEAIRRLHAKGGVIGGTSAGASAMSDTMLVSGESEESHRLGGALRMAPGLGLVNGVIVDQHFAERGRLGRLLAAVAQNPAHLGLGIDEDTAAVVEGSMLRVIGAGAVTVLDGRTITSSNVAEEAGDRTMSVFDVRLHVLSAGDVYDLVHRVPSARPAERQMEPA